MQVPVWRTLAHEGAVFSPVSRLLLSVASHSLTVFRMISGSSVNVMWTFSSKGSLAVIRARRLLSPTLWAHARITKLENPPLVGRVSSAGAEDATCSPFTVFAQQSRQLTGQYFILV